MEILGTQGWLPENNKFSPQSYPSTPYEYLRKWVSKTFQLSDDIGTKTFVVESVSMPGKNPVYTIKGSSDDTKEISEREFHNMVFDLPVP